MRVIVLLLVMFGTVPTMAAEWTHGLAMHGAPALAADFTHLPYVNPAAPVGGVLRQARGGTFDNLNPYSVRGVLAEGVELTQERLLARSWDEPFSLYGQLAEAVRVADDRTTVDFRLHPAARWNDGQPVTVADVIFSWDALRQQGRPNHRAFYSQVARATALDDRTVRFVIKPEAQANRELPLLLGLMPILARHYWQDRDLTATSLDIPVTSGPYRLAAVRPGQQIRYERRADYWGWDRPVMRGQHNFTVVQYDYYRDDQVALQALLAGQVDFRRETDPARWATAYDGPARQRGDIILREWPHGRPEPLRAFIFNARRPLLAERPLRQALARAFAGDWLNASLYHGHYRRTTSIFANSELAAPANLLPAPAGADQRALRDSLRRAQQELQQAGYVLRDGRLYHPAGAAVQFEVLVQDGEESRLAQEWRRALLRLGIVLTIRLLDSAAYQARLATFDYDIIAGRWLSSLSPGNEQAVYWGSAAARESGSRNYAGLADPVVDAAITAILQSADRAALVTAAQALDQAVMRGVYFVPFFYLGRDLVAFRAGLMQPDQAALYGVMPETWWWQKSG